MLIHCSISADSPERVARVLAAIWQGEASRFPPVPGAWIALAGDDRGTVIEVYPSGTEMVPGEAGVAFTPGSAASRHSPTHHAIATPLGEEEVLAIAQAAGWPAHRSDRPNFQVIELWLEGRLLVEVLTPPMQEQYRAFLTTENWRRFVAQQG